VSHEPAGLGGEPGIDEVVAAIRAMTVADLLRSTTFTFAQLAVAKLGEPTRDLDDARRAIEALRALLPLSEELLGAEAAADLRDTVASLQLAYADAAGRPADGPEEAPGDDGEERGTLVTP
jgi:hypothetical protein